MEVLLVNILHSLSWGVQKTWRENVLADVLSVIIYPLKGVFSVDKAITSNFRVGGSFED